ncbi:MAG: energy-coupling factor transporter transmembrane protein EcfT [Promethearchaeota archaeon]|nr:MAG: energy-coupling factor transporter transmembrane protein EcfT [Candidatus Lokiarchaeota archaeon]
MSFQFLDAFKFLKKDAFLHNLDPRTKLLLALIYTICALLFTHLIPLLLLLMSLIPIILYGKLGKEWLKSIRGLSFLLILIIVLNTFFISLSYALSMIIRILVMVSSFSIFFLTVDPNELSLSLISMRVPYPYAFSFSLAFRFVPTISMEAQNIIDAQQSRGYELQKKGLINQVKNLFPLLIPLIICAIRRAFNVAEALESRAFGSRKERTYYYQIHFTYKDWIFTSFLITLLIFSIFIKLNFNFMPELIKWSFSV